MYYDDDIIVYTDHTYAPRQLHVTEERVTPANPNASVDWEGSRFHESHVEYVLTPWVDADAVFRARAAVGGDITPATLTIDPTTATVQTMITPGTTAFSVTNGSLVAELTDKLEGPLSPGSGPVVGASLRKSLLLGAHVQAKAGACDLPLTSTAPVTFEVNEARVFVPGFEMGFIDELLAFSNSYRGGMFKSDLARIGSPAVGGATEQLSSYIEREVRPLTKALATLTHAELLTKFDAAWAAYRSFASIVLTETRSTADVDHFVVQGEDGLWRTNGIASSGMLLLGTADAVRTNLEGSRRDTTNGWTTRPLE